MKKWLFYPASSGSPHCSTKEEWVGPQDTPLSGSTSSLGTAHQRELLMNLGFIPKSLRRSDSVVGAHRSHTNTIPPKFNLVILGPFNEHVPLLLVSTN